MTTPTKKTFYYNFFPTKEEEESGTIHGRTMVEIRDVYSPPVVDPDNPWKIKLTLSQYELDSKKFVLSWNDTFDHVLYYWPFNQANSLDQGLRMDVVILDVTDDNNHKKYDIAYLQKGEGVEEFHLTCMELMENRCMQINGEIFLYWDSNQSCFVFKTTEVLPNEMVKDQDHLKLELGI